MALSREEGFKNPCTGLRVHAASFILNAQCNALPVGSLKGHFNRAPRGHRIPSVVEKVEQYLLQLSLVHHKPRQSLVAPKPELNVLPGKVTPHEVAGFAYNLNDVFFLEPQRALARYGKVLLCQIRKAAQLHP